MPSTLPSTKCSGAVLGTEYRQILPITGAVQGVPSSSPQEREAMNTVGRLALGSRQSPAPVESETNARPTAAVHRHLGSRPEGSL